MTGERTDWAGRIAFVLAVALAVAFVCAVVMELSNPPVRRSISAALAGGFGAMVGIVAAYVLRGRRRERAD